MSGNLLELAVGFWQQFFALIADRPDFTTPDSWTQTKDIARSVNFGMDFVREHVPDLSDFRVYFLAVAVIVPLFFSYIGLIFVNPLRVILWYFMVMFGFLLVVVGAAAAVVNDIAKSTDVHIQLNSTAAKGLLIVGSIVLFICFVLYGAREKLLTCCDAAAEKHKKVSGMSLEQRIEAETKDISWNATITRLIASGSLIVIGGSFVGVITTGPSLPIESLARGLGWFFITIALILFIWLCFGLFQKGREWQWLASNWAESNFLKFYLLSLSLIYIPIGGALFVVFNCNDFACPSGTRLFDEGSRAPFNRTSNMDICVPCSETNYPNTYCPTKIKNTMCAGSPDSRLEADLAIQCSTIRPFFWPAAVFVLIFYMFGVPYLFYKLIRMSTEALEERFPDIIDEDNPGQFKIAAYEESVLMTNNVSRFLYQPFKNTMKYTRLYIVVQKLLIVFTAVFIIRIGGSNPTAFPLFSAIVIHFLALIAFIYYRPFLRTFENYVATFLQIALVVAAILSILIFSKVELPTWLYITVLVLNFVLPCVALIVGIVLEWTGRQDQEEQDRAEAIAAVDKQLGEEEEQKKKEQDAQNQQQQMLAVQQQQQAAEAARQQQIAYELEACLAVIAASQDAGEEEPPVEALQQLEDLKRRQAEVPLHHSPLPAYPTTYPNYPTTGTGQQPLVTTYPSNNDNASSSMQMQSISPSNVMPTTTTTEQEQMNESTLSPKATPNQNVSDEDEDPDVLARQKGLMNPLKPLPGEDENASSASRKRRKSGTHHEDDEDYDDLDDMDDGGGFGDEEHHHDRDHHHHAHEQEDHDHDQDQHNKHSVSSSDNKSPSQRSSHEADTAAKRRRARLQARRKQLEKQVMRKIEVEKEIVEKRRNVVDMEIDEAVKGELNTQVMISGIAFLLAMCFCVVGLLSPSAQQLTAFGDETSSGTVAYEFVGYNSWQNFTEGCCCTSMASANNDVVVEKWVCENNRVKERLRRTPLLVGSTIQNESQVMVDGYNVRSLCSPVFKSGCFPVISTSEEVVAIWCYDAVPNVTGYAKLELW